MEVLILIYYAYIPKPFNLVLVVGRDRGNVDIKSNPSTSMKVKPSSGLGCGGGKVLGWKMVRIMKPNAESGLGTGTG